jgi:poly(3-hydroxybutyrate) depolymerase
MFHGNRQLSVLIAIVGALILVMLSSAVVSSQSPSQSPMNGAIVPSVVCADNREQSYALYLPSNYTPEKAWPILIALDPGARGKTPVEHFKDAAEQYGWIVVGSNQSRNGPRERTVEAVNAIWRDVHQRFSIDDRRVYFTGLSGGARAAVSIALSCNCAAGVIGAGAGFPIGVAPSAAVHFAHFALAGIDDFNFPEVKTLEEALAQAGVNHELKVFAGRHEWPPAEAATEAVEWMELQAMRSGTRARDEKVITQLWEKRMVQAQSFERAGQLYDAYQVYVAAGHAFKSLHDVAEVERQAASFAAKPEVKNAVRNEVREIKNQRDRENQIYGLLQTQDKGASLFDEEPPSRGSSSSAADPRSNVSDDVAGLDDDRQASSAGNRLRAIFEDLRKAANAKTDTSERRVARRVTSGLYIGFIERGINLLETKKRYAAAARSFELATEVSPERPGGFYYLAAAYASNSDKKKSLVALKTALEKGFTDIQLIKTNPAFASLRNEPAYQELIKKAAPGS